MESLFRAAFETDRANGKGQAISRNVGSFALERLTSGQWEMVDWFDADGRRFILIRQRRERRARTRLACAREYEVAACAARGESGKQMGYRFGVSPSMVSKRVRSLMRKLKVRTHAELVMQLRCLRGAGCSEGSQLRRIAD